VMGQTRGSDDAPLVALADRLEALRFTLADDPAALGRRAATIARLLRSVASRTADLGAPLLVVVAGGTGAGKSTTVNTLAGARVAAASVVRPTTRAPVLVCHPGDEPAFAGDRVLAGLPRVRGADDAAGAGERLVLRTSDGLPPGLALVDTPDVDSVEQANHQLAEDVLADADVWLWFVTARTYADEAGARYLRIARDRGVAVGVVVTQVRPGDRDEIVGDVARLLADEGVRADLLTAVPVADVRDDRLPDEVVAELRGFVTDLARADARAEARRRALAGVRAAVPSELAPIAEAIAEEQRAAARLTEAVDAAYAPLAAEVDVELEHGIPLRADVLDRWRDLVGGSDALVRMQTAAQRVRGAVQGLLGGSGPTTVESPRQVQTEVAGTVTSTLERLLERGRADARRRLEQDPVGRRLLDRQAALRTDDTAGRHDRVRAEVDAWGERVAELVATVGADRQVRARRWSTALNAVATSAILVVFTVSGGLTGGEVGIAALASAASQALLVRLFGEQNLRQLLADVHADLATRLGALTVVDRADLDAAVADATPDPGVADAVLDAAAAPPS
jgi:hypothetical protein